MKTLIENSVDFAGMPSPVNITIFNTEDPKTRQYFNVARLSGRKLRVFYKYDEDGVIKDGKDFIIQIPQGLDESGVKSFVIDALNDEIAK